MPASRPSLKITHILWSLAVLIVAMAAGIIVVYFHVQSFGNENFGSDQNIYTDIDKIPEAPAAIVFGAGINQTLRIANRLRAGQVFINEWFAGGIETPFGGVGLSGFGREKGQEAIYSYVQTRNIAIRLSHHA